MQRSLLLLLVAVVFSSTLSIARAEDEEPTLPLNPFTDAKEGDWETMTFVSERPGRGRTSWISTWRVKKVTDDSVSLELETIQPDSPGKPSILPRTFARKGKITVRDYFKCDAGEKLEDFKSTERKLTLAGHVFDGKQIAVKRTGGKFEGECVLILAAEVKGSGVVALEATLPGGGLQQHFVVGFGTAEKKLWGKTAEQIPLVDVKKGESTAGFNLYQDKLYGFSIHAPNFHEIQERQVATVFGYAGGMSSYAVLVQGDTTPRKSFKETSTKQIAEAGYKLVKEEEGRNSGKDTLQLEYTAMLDSPQGKIEGRFVDLFVFRDAHVINIRTTAPEKQFDGGAWEKSLRKALAGVKLIDIDSRSEHKGEEAGVFYDHRYGYKLPLPDFGKIKKDGMQTVVEFGGALEKNGNTSKVNVSVIMKAATRKEYKTQTFPGIEVVSTKDLEVSGRPALQLETKSVVNERPVQGLTLVVFDKARTFIVDATGAKAAWDEEGPAFRDAVASFMLEP